MDSGVDSRVRSLKDWYLQVCVLLLTGAALGAGAALAPEEAKPADKKDSPAASPGEEKGKYAKGCLDSDCHAKLKQTPAVHGPVAVAACDVCHKPVEGKEHAFDLTRAEEEVCTFCHAPPKARSDVHKPFREKACLGCHDPHGGPDRRFLAEGKSAGEICLGCHEKKDSKVAHKPYADGNCVGCHAAHQSDEDGLIRRKQPDLCLGCHQHLAMEMRGARTIHKPVKDGQCTGCHEAHGSSNVWLLAAAYPSDVYEAFDKDKYALCLTCHESSTFLDARDSKTGFRDGARNLHHLHVNKPEKGRSCRTCHPAHSSEGSSLVRKEVTFGNWRLPIGFEPTPHGGKCSTGCHKELSYDRDAESGAVPAPKEESGEQPGAKANTPAVDTLREDSKAVPENKEAPPAKPGS